MPRRAQIVALTLGLSLLARQSLASEQATTAIALPADDAAPMRAVVETGVIVGIGLTWYWLDYLTARDDEDLPFAFDTFRRKLTTLDGTRFDTSSPFHNAVGHAYGGGLYYNAWRSNGFSVWGAALANLWVSLFWEYLIEYRETASINDLIMTNFGGFAFGEAAHQFATGALRQSFGLTSVLGALASPWLAFNQAIDGRERSVHQLAGVEWRLNLRASGGAAYFRKSGAWRPDSELAFDSRTVRPKVGWSLAAPLTELRVSGGLTAVEGARFLGYAKNVFLGRFFAARGHTDHLLGGLATIFTYEQHPFPQGRDFVSAATPVALAFDAETLLGKLELRGTLEGGPSFGIVHSFAINSYKKTNDLSGAKTTLREHGYYYAYGWNARGVLRVTYAALSLRALVGHEEFWSIQGRDRFQRQVTDDFELRDERSSAAIELRLMLGRLWLSALATRYHARGEIDAPVEDTEDRLLLGLGMQQESW